MRSLLARLRRRDRPIDCHEVARILQHYLDDQLDTRRVELLVAHLDACRRCGLEAQTYRRIKGTLAGQRAALPAESVARLRQFGEQLTAGHHH